jgi:RNA polymerase sigma-70 factor (ECF subfamily)
MRRNSDQILTEWLVLQAQSRNSRALDQLLKMWYPILMRYATHQLGSEDAAKDVVQETLLSTTKSLRKIKDPAAFPKWVYQILQNRSADYLRKEIRIRRHKSEDQNVQSAHSTDDGDKLDHKISLHNALRKLNNDNYQVVHLYYLAGFSLRDIASLIGIPQGTVKSRLFSARNQLRQLLEE